MVCSISGYWISGRSHRTCRTPPSASGNPCSRRTPRDGWVGYDVPKNPAGCRARRPSSRNVWRTPCSFPHRDGWQRLDRWSPAPPLPRHIPSWARGTCSRRTRVLEMYILLPFVCKYSTHLYQPSAQVQLIFQKSTITKRYYPLSQHHIHGIGIKYMIQYFAIMILLPYLSAWANAMLIIMTNSFWKLYGNDFSRLNCKYMKNLPLHGQSGSHKADFLKKRVLKMDSHHENGKHRPFFPPIPSLAFNSV